MPHERTMPSAGEIAPMVRLHISRGAGVAAVSLLLFASVLFVAGKDPARALADTFSYTFGDAYGFSVVS